MDADSQLFEIAGSSVLVNAQPLNLSAEGFEVLLQGEHSHAAWLKNADGFYYLESHLAPWTLKKLRCGELVVIDHDYAKDSNTVFWGATPIPGSHPDSFRVVQHERPRVPCFAYDRKQLYALSSVAEGLQIWTDVDTASLEFFDETCTFADRNHLCHYNGHFINYENPSPQADRGHHRDILRQRQPDADAWWNWTDTHLAALRPLGHTFYGDDRRVYHHFAHGTFDYPFPFGLCQDAPFHLVLTDADPGTFQPLNAYYGKDQRRVYHLARAIGADPESFRVIDGPYATDRSGIWFNGYLCPQADASSFEVIRWSSDDWLSFAKDKSSVFSAIYGSRIGKHEGYSRLLRPLKSSDPDTFVMVNDVWAKDARNVYCHGKPWPGIDAGTFEFLFTDPTFTATSYARCKNGLYNANGRRSVKGVDGASFSMLNTSWGKDQHSVFGFKTERVHPRMDAATFEVTDDAGGARDKDFIYALNSLNAVVKRKRPPTGP